MLALDTIIVFRHASQKKKTCDQIGEGQCSLSRHLPQKWTENSPKVQHLDRDAKTKRGRRGLGGGLRGQKSTKGESTESSQ